MDTNLPNETRRWVFTRSCDGLRDLGREVSLPLHFLKLSGPADDLMAALPPAWQLQTQGYLMISKASTSAARLLPNGYRLQTERNGPTASAHIMAPDGSLAASGYTAEAMGVFIYDRIVTAPGHQRMGLGTIIMNALKAHRVSSFAPELLVATEDGRRLYTSLGWAVLSPFSTAVIPG